MKNIAFAKIGKSILFNHKGSSFGGEIEAPAIIASIANHNPDKTFYLVGKSNFSTLSDIQKRDIFNYDNVVDVWAGIKTQYNETYYRHIINYFDEKNIKIDYGIMMVGQIGTVTVPNKIRQLKNPNLFASVIEMTKGYTTPIAVWLNKTKISYLEIINDPRYCLNQSRDMFHLPEKSLSQYDYTYKVRTIKSYDDQDLIYTDINATYEGMEVAYCYGRKFPVPDDINHKRTNDFVVVLNEGSKPSRYSMIKEWVLDHHKNVKIYGKWEHENVKTDDRFVGSIPHEELQTMLKNVKYTFIIPISDGWVTSKYIEMIHSGVIPFFHPSYDTQRHLAIPDFFRPKTPKEFQERIKLIQEDDEFYKTTIAKLRKLALKESYYDGSFINEKIMGSFIENYSRPDLSKYEKKTVLSLENFFDS